MTTITIGDITISHPNKERALFLLKEELTEQIKLLEFNNEDNLTVNIDIQIPKKEEACIQMN